MFGLLLVGAFATIVLAYLLTEYLLTRLDVRRRVLVGDGAPLTAILYANGLSFLLVTVSSFVILFAAGIGLYAAALLVCVCAQGVWLIQHLWFYYRDHLRLRYE